MRIEKIGFASYRIGSVDFAVSKEGFVSAASDWDFVLQAARREMYGLSLPDNRSTLVKFDSLFFTSFEAEYRRVRDEELTRIEANKIYASGMAAARKGAL